MKKWLSIILVCILTLNALPALGEAEETDASEVGTEAFDDEFPEDETAVFESEAPGTSEQEQTIRVEYDYDHLTVGNPTQMNGLFFTDLWGTNTSDIDVRHLVTGYNLVTWDTGNSMFRFDRSVVSGATIGDDQDGNRRYLISLYDDLHYSDGTPVRSWDYAFSVLLQCSPVIASLGGKPANCDYLLGYEDYAAGRTETLAGLSVIDDFHLVFVVRKESLPYFYELSRLNFSPYPIGTIAPGCKVYDDGAGVYIGNEKKKETEPLFTEELLRETILTPESGYLFHPVPGSGPYTIQSFDGTTAEFAVNPWYKGNEAGEKPRIAGITYTHALNDTMITELGTGKFALLNKVMLAESIQQGLKLNAEQPQYTRATYPRTGLTYFYFLPTSPIAQSEKVRKAMAYCLDKAAFIRDYTGAYGIEADGLYGLSQWMYQIATGAMIYTPPNGEPLSKEEEEAWEAINLDGLTRYPFNPEEAVRLLEEDGWTLNEKGETFTSGKDSIRYKETDGTLQPLQLTISYTKTTEIEQPLTQYFIDNLTQAGFQVALIQSTIGELEHVFDGTASADCDLLYLGNNFSTAFNPSAIFAVGTRILTDSMAKDSLPAVHSELFSMAEDMDRTEPEDVLTYMQKWVSFQERLSETLPILPVYINVYFDFYTKDIHEYWIADQSTWADAIVPVRMYDYEEDEDEDPEDSDDDFGTISDEKDSVDLTKIKEKHKVKEEADPDAGALASFPKKIRDQIPTEYRTINEFITASLSEYQNVESATVEFAFQTKYKPGDTVYLIFGNTENRHTRWFVQAGQVQKNGSVSVILSKEQLDKLAGKQFTLVAVSKE